LSIIESFLPLTGGSLKSLLCFCILAFAIFKINARLEFLSSEVDTECVGLGESFGGLSVLTSLGSGAFLVGVIADEESSLIDNLEKACFDSYNGFVEVLPVEDKSSCSGENDCLGDGVRINDDDCVLVETCFDSFKGFE